MRLTGHVACVGERRGAYRFWLKNVREKETISNNFESVGKI
jgi:hypothetical protein